MMFGKQNIPCCTMFDCCQTTVPKHKNCSHSPN